MQLYQHLRLSSTGRLATWANALALGACLLLAALACGLRSPLHDLPLERDEGAYAIIATRWLAGDALYRDLFDHKPPLVYLVFALARILPGDAVRAIRELATLYLLLVSFAVLALGWRLYGRWPGVAAQALVLAYGTSRAFEGLTFNSESVLILPATLGCLLVVVGMQGRRPALFGWAGMCVGLAVASKPVGAVLLAPQVLAPLMVPWPWRRRLAGASLGLAGAALPLLGFGLLLWRQGALAAAFEALISYNRLYAADSVAQGWYFEQLWRIWAPMFALGLPALAGLVATTAFREWRTAAQAVTALWGLVLLATALLSLR